MKWLIQLVKLQLSIFCAHAVHALLPINAANFKLMGLLTLGNIVFMLLHPESAFFGIAGIFLIMTISRVRLN